MYPSTRLLSSKYFLYCVLQMLGFVLLLNTAACHCNQEIAPTPVPAVDMEVPHSLLIGNETNIEVIFQIKGTENEVNIGDFKLKVIVGEQQAFRGLIDGSQISYKDAHGSQQTLSNPAEKSLTEFINVDPAKPSKNPHELKAYFKLAPAPEVIQMKIHFELLDHAGKTIKNIELEWIKSEIVISPVKKFKKGESSFTLRNLKEDIKDLRKITVRIPEPPTNKVSFLVGGNKKTETTLAELFPHINSIAKGQEIDPIKIVVDDLNDEDNEPVVFSILLLATDKLPIDEGKSEWHKQALSTELESLLEEIKKLEAKERPSKEELALLKNHKKTFKKTVKNLFDGLRLEKIEIQAQEDKIFKKLAEEEKKALRGKGEKEQRVIKAEYKKKRMETRSETKFRLEYRNGLKNAIKHNFFGMSLKEGKTQEYLQGQRAGHRLSLVIARIEATIGPTLVSIGIGTTIAAGIPTLGGIAVITLPMLLVGAGLVTHGTFVIERAQTNLDYLKAKEGIK